MILSIGTWGVDLLLLVRVVEVHVRDLLNDDEKNESFAESLVDFNAQLQARSCGGWVVVEVRGRWSVEIARFLCNVDFGSSSSKPDQRTSQDGNAQRPSRIEQEHQESLFRAFAQLPRRFGISGRDFGRRSIRARSTWVNFTSAIFWFLAFLVVCPTCVGGWGAGRVEVFSWSCDGFHRRTPENQSTI